LRRRPTPRPPLFPYTTLFRSPEWDLSSCDVARALVAAIGPATAEALVRRGVVPDLVPDRFVAEAVVSALAAQGEVRGKTVLLPRSEGHTSELQSPDHLVCRLL